MRNPIIIVKFWIPKFLFDSLSKRTFVKAMNCFSENIIVLYAVMQSGLCIQKKLPKRLDEWENQSIQISPDVEHAFEKYLLRIEQSEYTISSSDDRPSSDHFYKNRSWFVAAAVVIILFSIS